jgi:imidazolonepropionase-like amidohydrolase
VLAAPGTSTLKVSGRAVTRGEDVFPFRAQWRSPSELVYTADGRIRRRDLAAGTVATIPFAVRLPYDRPAFRPKAHDFDSRARRPARGIVKPVLSPDGERVAFGALGDLWVMELGERPRRITRDRFVEDDPAWSPDGRRLAYTSDRAGSADLYVRVLRTGRVRRVTSAPGAEVAPAWSRDGRRLAFQDEEDATSALDLATGAVRPLVPAAWEPSTPTWGPGDRTVALAALRPASDRFREGTSQILAVDATTGAQRWVQPIPFASLSNRVSSGPVWSPDGASIAFVVASRLWVQPVDAQGTPRAEPRRVTDEIAESPSWSGDSDRLLYLSRGRLRLVAADGGRPRTVPVRLGWRRSRAPRAQVVHAGALWDGVRRTLRRDVDITVRGRRIVRVERHRAGRDVDVDASGLTVMPGLWDAHVHQELQRAELGARQGAQQLAFGVTTTVSMGDTAYEVLEDREALAAGRRLGPRLLAAVEPLDGSRVYYDFMRPVRDLEELRRELERVEAFDPDLLKTYVRLPFRYQARAYDLGHDLGLPGFSHYWEPSIAFGQDGMSHISATQRLGFSRTQSTSGFTYHDVIRTARASGASITSTLFSATALLAAEDRGFLADPRVRRLYTPSQAAELEEYAEPGSPEEEEQERVQIARDVRVLRDVGTGGGRVLAGTDLPLEPVGVHLHLNLRAMVRGGFTTYDALRTATALPAEHFGLAGDLGTVRPGRLADLAFVRGDPLRRIEAAADVRMVMTDGRLRRLPELLAPFPGD